MPVFDIKVVASMHRHSRQQTDAVTAARLTNLPSLPTFMVAVLSVVGVAENPHGNAADLQQKAARSREHFHNKLSKRGQMLRKAAISNAA
jgi:hypothetical protein